MNHNRKIARVALLVFLLCGLAPPAARASSVTLAVGSSDGASGSKVEVPIRIRGAQHLGALQAELTYDPAILEPTDVVAGSMPQDITVGHHVTSPGRLRMVMNTSAREAISGDGELMKAVFTVTGESGRQCDLRLEAVQAWDNTKPDAPPYAMLVDVEPGRFAVSGGGLPMGPIVLVGAGVALLVVITRRRKPGPAAARAPAGGAPAAFCSGCGAALAPGARFCAGCGRPSS